MVQLLVNHTGNYAERVASLLGLPALPAAAEQTSDVSILSSSSVHFPIYNIHKAAAFRPDRNREGRSVG